MMDRTVQLADRTPDASNLAATRQVNDTTTAEIGPRVPGVVYYDGPALVEVLDVVTDPAEARRVMRRNAAKFAVLVKDLHAGTERYTGAIWTGSDRVLKAVAA
nr:hypothetical protein OH837_48835 [Streptomyces canus]